MAGFSVFKNIIVNLMSICVHLLFNITKTNLILFTFGPLPAAGSTGALPTPLTVVLSEISHLYRMHTVVSVL
jgi:hypothetical protein